MADNWDSAFQDLLGGSADGSDGMSTDWDSAFQDLLDNSTIQLGISPCEGNDSLHFGVVIPKEVWDKWGEDMAQSYTDCSAGHPVGENGAKDLRALRYHVYLTISAQVAFALINAGHVPAGFGENLADF